MKKILALSALIMFSATAYAFDLRTLSGDTMAAEAFLSTTPVFNLNLLNNSEPLAPSMSPDASRSISAGVFADAAVPAWASDRPDQGGKRGWWNPLPGRRPTSDQNDNPPRAPEPATMLLLGAGLIGLAQISRRGLQH